MVGIALFVTLLAPYGAGDIDPVQKVAFLVDNQALMYLWNQIIYVVFDVCLVVLVLALYERSKADSPAIGQAAAVFGMIWAALVIASGMIFNVGLLGTVVDLYSQDPARAASVWLAISSAIC